jgi:NTE family protein
LSPAIHTGADRILVIAVRDRKPDPSPTGDEARYPSLGAISGSLLDIIFMDSLDADIERARRVDDTISLIYPDNRRNATLRNIEIMVLEPSQDVCAIARQYADAMPWTIRTLFHRFGIWGRDWRLISYLMFEAPYLEALMELGYRDTIARFSLWLPRRHW